MKFESKYDINLLVEFHPVEKVSDPRMKCIDPNDKRIGFIRSIHVTSDKSHSETYTIELTNKNGICLDVPTENIIRRFQEL